MSVSIYFNLFETYNLIPFPVWAAAFKWPVGGVT